MAISLTHYQLLKLLKDRGELPQGGRILEIGKANWYGDSLPSVVDPALADDADGFEVVERLYGQLFSPKPGCRKPERNPKETRQQLEQPSVIAFDQDQPAVERGAKPWDLNTFAILFEDGRDTFSTVINHGTAEHVFNIANVFNVMHDACVVGGLMIHEAPFTGWQSHGFFNLQPTLFYDVARENGYEMVLVATEHLRSRSYQIYDSHEAILQAKFRDQLPDHAMLFVAMRKKSDGLFKIPTQAVYCGAASEFVRQAWRELR